MRIKILLPVVFVLGGCAAIDNKSDTSVQPVETNVIYQPKDDEPLCLVNEASQTFERACDLSYWIGMWVEAAHAPWPQRKERIAALSDSTEDTITKVVLSLPVDTPYQSRLRAQHWLGTLTDVLNPDIAPVINTLVKDPNGEMLELESAMVILNRVNTDKQKQLEMLEQELKLQTEKMEELLKIEATLMDKNRSNQP
ncbi:hypothetical protein [Alteromonas sp. C1M14]|uniref:hypothetical protein n=1 Tax=Alteromonas sp. C1M14 TaxID=2841567 RepID=UPI001C09F7E3|nr:hypothetical protein [Alteromonas sp. C1M14]MBU2977408.1 hypothetical protein [Alteromonas sp. C1M14]